MDENMGPTTENGMAESYELSEDGLTFTVTLRDGLMWHDGQEVTTDDVLWSMATILNDTILANNLLKAVMGSIEGAEDVQAGTTDTFFRRNCGRQ